MFMIADLAFYLVEGRVFLAFYMAIDPVKGGLSCLNEWAF